MQTSILPIRTLLLSCYELGRQPFALGSAAAWLKREGAEVASIDCAIQEPDRASVERADLIAFHVPMHTATRVAVELLAQVRQANPTAHLCFFGLYAPMNDAFLRGLGVDTILGGEFEEGLVSLVRRLTRDGAAAAATQGTQIEPTVSLAKQSFLVPDRTGLPDLNRYAKLRRVTGELETVGYVEATRGCKHRCRHCPVVPIYDGAFRVVQRDVVLEDIRRQVAAGAGHITFGDPDFLNGPRHAQAIVEALHEEFPELTYDVTVKVEHLLHHAEMLPVLKETGCLFVTTAVEALDDTVIRYLDKGHTAADFRRVVELARDTGLVLNPTFVAFTPWTTLESYADLLESIAELELVNHVAAVQWAIRLLIPAGSRLLELEDVRELVEPFDEPALAYPWKHPDPRMDALQQELESSVATWLAAGDSRHTIFGRIRGRVSELTGAAAAGGSKLREAALHPLPPEVTVPYLTEPWYC